MKQWWKNVKWFQYEGEYEEWKAGWKEFLWYWLHPVNYPPIERYMIVRATFSWWVLLYMP